MEEKYMTEQAEAWFQQDDPAIEGKTMPDRMFPGLQITPSHIKIQMYDVFDVLTVEWCSCIAKKKRS